MAETNVKELGILRSHIDDIDEEIIKLLDVRTQIVLEIAEIKDTYKANTVQKGRWQKVLDNIKRLCNKHNLNFIDVEKIWEAIHQQSINAQNNHRKNK